MRRAPRSSIEARNRKCPTAIDGNGYVLIVIKILSVSERPELLREFLKTREASLCGWLLSGAAGNLPPAARGR